AFNALQRVRYPRGMLTAMLLALSLASGFSLADNHPLRIAIYRGAAGCEGCSEMVMKALHGVAMPLSISYIGENEKQTLNA
ncbi:hypothetical protein WKI12_23840, partial [Pantoea agglomerans]